MIKAIVYQSETGHSKEYAELLGKQINLPIYDRKKAVATLPKNTEIIYIGWLMAGKVSGYKKALKHFSICAVCAVGMSGKDSQIDDIKKINRLSKDMPVFYLPGGFELEKLHGIYRFMMNTMKKTVGKSLSKKEDRTPEEDDMLDLMLNGGNRVCEANLSEVKSWYKNIFS